MSASRREACVEGKVLPETDESRKAKHLPAPAAEADMRRTVDFMDESPRSNVWHQRRA
jgi:hypothetical protein